LRNEVKEDGICRICSMNGKKGNAYRTLVGEPEGIRPRRRWVGDTKIDLREIGWVGVDSIHLAQDRDQWGPFVNTIMKLRVP
jgi:hypothetical protein